MAPTELRPSAKAYRRAWAVSAPAPLVITLGNMASDDLSWPVDLAIAGATFLVMDLGVLLLLRVSRVQRGEDALVKRSMVGSSRVIPYADVATVLLVPCYRRFNAPTTTLLAFLARDGRALLRLDGVHWDSAALRRLAPVTGAPVMETDGERTPGELRRSWPGALNLGERRFGLLWKATGVFVVLVVGFAVVARSAGWT